MYIKEGSAKFCDNKDTATIITMHKKEVEIMMNNTLEHWRRLRHGRII